jgi:transcriptional regulator with XRE-family HTH domain
MMISMEQTLGALIAAHLHPHTRMTAKELAERIGRSPSYVSQLVHNQKAEAPPPDVMTAIERELGISVVTQLRAWGYAIPEGPRPAYPSDEVRVLAERWSQFTSEDRMMLRYVLDAHLRLNGDEGVGNLVQSVDDPPLAFRRSVAG